jgi:hypothetical protein
MTAKTIKIPALPSGLTISVQVRNISSLALLETVTMTENSGVYIGTVAGAHAGQLLWVILSSGIVLQHRVRTIQNVAATFVILTELEELASVDSGPSGFTITVNDGTNPVTGATVRVSGAGISRSKTTNVAGQSLFALENSDYNIIVVKPGFEPEFATVTVSGITTLTVSLTAIATTTPPAVYLSTGVGLVLDEVGAPEAGVSVSIQLTSGPGTDGYILDQKIRTLESDGDGIVAFDGLIRGATYAIWRGVGTPAESVGPFSVEPTYTRATFVVPNTSPFSLAEALGIDAEVV